MSSAEQQAIFDDILANPDDDTPRLVFADWLDEHGLQPDLAEFIRGQIRLHGLNEWDEGSVELEVRCRQLLQAHEEEWLAPLAEIDHLQWCWSTWQLFSRGFLERVELSPTHFVQVSERLLARVPIRGIALSHFWNSPPVAPLFWACMGLERLRQLWIYWHPGRSPIPALSHLPAHWRLVNFGFPSDMVAEPARVITDSPIAPNLQRLELVSRGTDASGWQPLWQTNRLSRLTHFSFRTRIPLASQLDFPALVSAPWFGGLRRLELDGSGEGRGAEAVLVLPDLAGLLRSTPLRALALRECGFPERAAASFRSMPAVELEHLDLGSGRGVSKRNLRAILQSPGLARLRSFALAGNGNAALTYLMDSPCRESLRVLRLSGCRASGLLGLLRLSCPQLTRLSIGCYVSSRDRRSLQPDLLPAVVEALFDPHSLPRLASLTIINPPELLRRVAQHPGAGRLKELGIQTAIGPREARELAGSASLERLARLGVRGYQFRTADAEHKETISILQQRFGSRLGVLE